MEAFSFEAALPPEADNCVKPSSKDFDPVTGRGRIRVWFDCYGTADLTARLLALKELSFQVTITPKE